MKKLCLPAVMLGMTTLLTACLSAGGGNPPPAGSYVLTVSVTGTTAAPVKVTNTTSGAVVWNDSVTTSKTFGGIGAGSVLRVEGSAVNGLPAPAPQTVTMDGDKTVVLSYAATGGVALDPRRIGGLVTGTNLMLGNAYIGSPDTVFFGKIPLVSNTANADLTLLTPSAADLQGGQFSNGCSGAPSDPAARTLSNASLDVFSPQGEYLGLIFERVVGGADAQRAGSLIVRLYSDRAFTFQGTCTYTPEPGTTITETVNVSVKQGWNALAASFDSATSRADVRNAAASDRVQLEFSAEQPRVAVTLAPQTLEFPADPSAAVTADATLLQIGGYSGQVALSTDVPGLTIEPSTVTLASLPTLTAQGAAGSRREGFGAWQLRPQKLVTKLSFRYTGSQSGTLPFNVLVKDAAGKQVGNGLGTAQVIRPSFALNASECCVQLPAGSSRDLNFSLYSQQGFAGNVTVTAGNLPAGVTSTSTVVALGANSYVTGTIRLTAATTAPGGSSRITLTGVGGAVTASSALELTVPAPAVTLSTTAVTLYAGESVNLPVTVQASNGFEGAVQLTATGLPAGVTASTKSVTLARNGAAALNLSLTGAATLTASAATIKVIATATGLNISQDTSLQTRPQRLSLGSVQLYGMGAAPSGGFWYVRQPFGSGAAGTLARFDGTKEVEAVVLPYSSYNYYSIATSPAGDVWLATNGGAVLRYAGGKLQSWEVSTGNGNLAVDAQGRLWMVAGFSATSSYALSRFNTTTGKFEAQIGLGTDYQVSYGPLAASRDGSLIYFYDTLKKDLVRVDTATAAASRVGVAGLTSITNLAVDAQGTPWLYGRAADYSTRVARVAADGTTSLYPAYAGDALEAFGFDQDGLLWLSSSGYGANVVAFDPVAGVVSKTLIAESQSPRSALEFSGGVWRTWSDFTSSSTYASLLK